MEPRSHSFSSLSCELRIIRARNIELSSAGRLFVRCYLSAGNNKRVRLETKEISSRSDQLFWNQAFSLDCSGTGDSINLLRHGNLVFELRSKNTASFLGTINGSKLVARAEIPWKNFLDATKMEVEKWVVMIPMNKRVQEDVKPPAVQIAMKIQISAKVARRENECLDECGCIDSVCNSSWVEYEIFAIGAALEAL